MSQSLDLTIDDDCHEGPFNSQINVIEYQMLDKSKYFPLVATSSFLVRTVVYPLTVIKTRMQIQKSRKLYSGTFSAAKNILKHEGVKGLYSGFLVQNLSTISQMTFLTTYERIRFYLADKHAFKSNQLRAFIAGGCASIVAQTIVVPIDIVVQHLQTDAVYSKLVGNTHKSSNSFFDEVQFSKKRLETSTLTNSKKNYGISMKHISPTINLDSFKKSIKITGKRNHTISQKHSSNIFSVISKIFAKQGWRGFYKGFGISVLIYTPSSAIWWLTYDTVCDKLSLTIPTWIPRLAIQCMAAMVSATTTTIITTPIDTVKARVQVEKTMFMETAQKLWREERMKMFIKALPPRLIQNVFSSFFVILGYETIKRWSLSEEYKHNLKW